MKPCTRTFQRERYRWGYLFVCKEGRLCCVDTARILKIPPTTKKFRVTLFDRPGKNRIQISILYGYEIIREGLRERAYIPIRARNIFKDFCIPGVDVYAKVEVLE